ncbi:MAG: NAD(P)-binding domain-containing protein, partial [Planctomycetota bacterium]
MNHPQHRTSEKLPVVIVGAGPVGLELAVALQKSGQPVRLIEAGSVGHTMTWWAPQTRWFSSNERIAIAGVPLVTPDQTKATREQYLAYLRAVATQFELPIQCRTRVSNVQRIDDGLIVTCESGGTTQSLAARAVVLAIGGTDHPRKLGIEGEDLPHVDGYLREPHQYFGRRVMIIGGRNSAVEAALRIHHAGGKVALCYRRDELPNQSIKYWLRPEINGLIDSGRIDAFLGAQPIAITPTEVHLRKLNDGSEFSVA